MSSCLLNTEVIVLISIGRYTRYLKGVVTDINNSLYLVKTDCGEFFCNMFIIHNTHKNNVILPWVKFKLDGNNSSLKNYPYLKILSNLDKNLDEEVIINTSDYCEDVLRSFTVVEYVTIPNCYK